MSTIRRIRLIIWLVLLLGAAVFAIFWQSQPRFDWTEKKWGKKAYSEENDQPYGSMVLHRLLQNYFPGHSLTDLKTPVSKGLPVDSTGHTNYVFIGESMRLDSLSNRRLLEFVGQGNTALLISKSIPADLMGNVYADSYDCEETGWGDYATLETSIASLSIINPRLDSILVAYYARQNKPRNYTWRYLDSSFFCDDLNYQSLGMLQDSFTVFASFRYGKGKFLIHTDPIVFSNYSLLKPKCHEYVGAVLSWLPEGNIYWDASSRAPEHSSGNANNKENPLQYILKQPALAIAWYLLVGLSILWLIFRGRRRQRVIPILAKSENSSYEFISTIANLHFRDKNYRGLCMQSMKLFLAQIRERYNLVAPINPATGQPRIDDAFFKRLVVMSQVPEPQILDIFTQYNHTVNYEPTEQMMTDLYLSMEAFFKIAK
jgi:hypothetical protein